MREEENTPKLDKITALQKIIELMNKDNPWYEEEVRKLMRGKNNGKK